jgi:sec-independent protein translocase protein TatA
MPTLGIQELMLVLGIAVLLFGGRKIPELAKGMGQGIREFKDALKDDKPA